MRLKKYGTVYLNAANDNCHLAALSKQYQRPILVDKICDCMSNAE